MASQINESLILEWQEKRKNLYGYESIDSEHECSELVCVKDGWICTIDRKRNLYGCLLSGKIHECKRNDNCTLQICNNECTWICLFSSCVLANHLESKPFGPSNRDQVRSDDGNYRDKNELEDDEEMDVDYSMDEEELAEELLASEIQEFYFNQPGEFNSLSFFDDVNGEERPENEKVDQKLEESEIMLEQKVKKKRRSHTRNVHNGLLTEQARSIIVDMLWNRKNKDNVKKTIDTQNKKIIANRLKKYYKMKRDKKQRPNLVEIENIIYSIIKNDKQTDPSECNYELEKREYYIEQCIKLWNIILKSPYYLKNQGQFNFDRHVKACLELMKTGYFVHYQDDLENKVTIFKEDPYMKELLLEKNAIKHMSHSNRDIKKQITRGRNIIKAALISYGETTKLEKILDDYRFGK
jgi:hypothetical protein